jgi:diacylglycerol kinase family enzyme
MSNDGGLKKYAVIYNARARNAKKLPVGAIVKTLDENGFRPLIYQTQARGDGIKLVKNAIEDGAERIYAAGGDGTLNEVISGLMAARENGAGACHSTKGAGAASLFLPQVCPIPLGTVNVFAKESGFSSDAQKALLSSFSAKCAPMDIGACNGRYFIMMASAGFDAFVINDIEKMIANESNIKKFCGPFAYLLAGLKSILNYDFPKLKITARSVFGVKEFYADFAVVSNTKYYGGRYILSENADPRDGFLDLFMLNSKDVNDYFKFFFQVVTKRYNFRGLKISRYQIKQCLIEETAGPSACGVYSQIDGEIHNQPPLDIRIYEKALNLVTLN